MRGLIIIPAYNEENNIAQTLEQFSQAPSSWDLLVVDDGSRDRTVQMVSDKARLVSLPMNLGIGTAVQTGYQIACLEDYDWALQFDGDGQHLAQEIPKLLEELPNNACVVGSRYCQNSKFKATSARRFGSKYFSQVLKIFGCQDVTDPTSGFRLCDRRAIALFSKNYPLDYPEVEARLMLHRRKLPTKEVPVEMHSRKHGKSSIQFFGACFYLAKVTLSLIIGRGR